MLFSIENIGFTVFSSIVLYYQLPFSGNIEKQLNKKHNKTLTLKKRFEDFFCGAD